MRKQFVKPPRIDWFRVIATLERADYSQRRIAEVIGKSKGWVTHLKESPGAEPRYDDGRALLELWRTATNKPISGVPRDKGYDG